MVQKNLVGVTAAVSITSLLLLIVIMGVTILDMKEHMADLEAIIVEGRERTRVLEEEASALGSAAVHLYDDEEEDVDAYEPNSMPTTTFDNSNNNNNGQNRNLILTKPKDVIKTCVKKKDGELRVVKSNRSCKKWEFFMNWRIVLDYPKLERMVTNKARETNTLKTDVNAIEQDIVDHADAIDDLDSMVTTNNGKLADMSTRVQSAEDKIDNHTDMIDSLNSFVTTNRDNLSTLNASAQTAEDEINNHTDKINSLKSMVTTNSDNLSILNASVGSNTDNINELSTDVIGLWRKVFITSKNYVGGELGGVAGANAICQSHADAAGHDGIYLAWISDSSGNSPATTFPKSDVPYVLASDTTKQVAKNWADLTDGNLLNSINRNEYGNEKSKYVWTSTYPNGTSVLGNNCKDWSDTSKDGITGNPSKTDSDWTKSVFQYACHSSNALYCFQSESLSAVSTTASTNQDTLNWVSPTVTRNKETLDALVAIVDALRVDDNTVFVTKVNNTGNLGGLYGADAICQSYADSAGLGGVYRAWLSDSLGNSPANRFVSQSSRRYVLTDGTVIANNWADLVDGNLLAPINKGENQERRDYKSVWTGTKSDGTSQISSANCDDWTVGRYGTKGANGNSGQNDTKWTDSQEIRCSYERALYCFQQ